MPFTEEDARRVKRRLMMTKIERMYAEEKEAAVNKAREEAKRVAQALAAKI